MELLLNTLRPHEGLPHLFLCISKIEVAMKLLLNTLCPHERLPHVFLCLSKIEVWLWNSSSTLSVPMRDTLSFSYVFVRLR